MIETVSASSWPAALVGLDRHPRPIAETSRPWLPNVRLCICFSSPGTHFFVIPAQAGIHILKGSNLLRFGVYGSPPPRG